MERSRVIDALMHFLPGMELGVGQPNEKALELLDEMTLDGLFAPHDIRDRSAALACLAGVRLLINDVEGAHKIAQDLDTPEGSFWHAIVHRRDGDFWNAKYWIRKVGLHPVYLELGPELKNVGFIDLGMPSWLREGRWDAYGFVDLVEKAHSDKGELQHLCRQVQQAEWQVLFDFCFDDAHESCE